MRIVLLFLLFLFSYLGAKDITPFLTIKVDGLAKDIALGKENQLVIGTDSGKMMVYDYKDKKFVKIVQVPKIKDFMGDIIDTRVSSVDYLDGRYLLVSDSGVGGYSDLRIHENNKTIDIFTENDKLPIIEAKFITKDKILLGFLSNEVALYDLKNKKFLYKEQLTESKFSDLALNEDRSLAAVSCESGEVDIVSTKDGKILKRLSGLNLDNVYRVDLKKDMVSCAGQDRRGAWYNIKTGKGDYIEAKFLVYATALSPDAKEAAFALDEKNNIYIIDLATKATKYLLKGQKSTLNNIIYKDKNTLFSASDDEYVLMWKLDKGDK
ncbi:MAG: hypothetical protein GXN91_02965 [Epsilonproteobacteria bacterium]|nr:hypothetical protein [Campylobacterota bacterium]